MTAFSVPRDGDDALSVRTVTAGRGYLLVKRGLDVVVASVCLMLLLPVLVLGVLVVLVSSKGPVMFRQTRVGTRGQPFVMFKLRTMRWASSDEIHRAYVEALLRGEAQTVNGLYKLSDDSRITRVGAVLRKLSIDELPQLINVLRGDMSMVGPRPALPWEVELFPDWSRARFQVPAGITGLWQVSGRNRLTMLEGLVLDLEYVQRCSIWLDIRILARTVPALLRGGAR
jgi:lipopolysaccharide/colanic/teichoic acid biosynthesis glycosyltransferase